MLAETERYRREAIEAGQRQRGDSRRRFHDEIVRSLNLSRQNTVCAYLENVLVECLDKIAEHEARDQIRATVQRIDAAAQNPSSAVAVGQMLDRFILPNVFRRIAHENYLADLHTAFFGDKLPDMIEERRRQRMNRFLEAAVVSPRSAGSSSSRSHLSTLTVDEDVAHHEALHCIRRVLAKTMRRTAVNEKTETEPDNQDGGREADGSTGNVADGEVSILDDIVQSVSAEALWDGELASVDAAASTVGGSLSARSTEQQEQLIEIVKNVNDALWEYAEKQTDAEESVERQEDAEENANVFDDEKLQISDDE